jgi:hypothetical protein
MWQGLLLFWYRKALISRPSKMGWMSGERDPPRTSSGTRVSLVCCNSMSTGDMLSQDSMLLRMVQ